MEEPTIPDPKATRQAVRTKARLVSLKLLDRAESLADSMDADSMGKVLGHIGKLAGVESQRVDVKHSGSVAHLHLDALRAAMQRPSLSYSSGNGTLSDTVTPLQIAQPVDAQVVSVDTQGTGDPSEPDGAEQLGHS